MQIRLIPNEESLQEWMIIELQGRLEFDTYSSNKTIGHFTWKGDGKNKIPQFLIGHHMLEGKVVELERPFFVMDRSTFRSHANKSELLGRTIEMNRCDFVAIIRRKIVFKERPRPTLPGETPSKSTGKQKTLLKYA